MCVRSRGSPSPPGPPGRQLTGPAYRANSIRVAIVSTTGVAAALSGDWVNADSVRTPAANWRGRPQTRMLFRPAVPVSVQ